MVIYTAGRYGNTVNISFAETDHTGDMSCIASQRKFIQSKQGVNQLQNRISDTLIKSFGPNIYCP